MSSPILDFEKLLAPVPGDNPAGANLREDFSADSLYQRVKDARMQARDLERRILKQDPDINGTQPDWDPILDLAPVAIAEKAKDLEIVAWLTEALVRNHEFAGLQAGLQLARQLIDQYWDQLYPLPDPDGDGIAARIAPLAGLNATLLHPINNIPLTQGRTRGPYSRSDYDRASTIEKSTDPDKRAKLIESANGLSMPAFEAAIRESSPDFFRARAADLDACLAEISELSSLLDARCGEHSPSLADIRDALEACRSILTEKASTALLQPQSDASPDAANPEQQQGGLAPSSPGSLRSREDAFQSLLRVAEFFRQREPHSPVSYALEQVVRWGRKPLPELWSELIGEEQVRTSVFKLVGITAPPPPENQVPN